MDIDHGVAIMVEAEEYQAVSQWAVPGSGPVDGTVHIQVGTLAIGGWYVRHNGFGDRRFGDKQAAWQAVRALMARHEGRWEQVAVDPAPFLAVRRRDGSRVVYDTADDECMYAFWGGLQERLWDRYLAAIHAGATLRSTKTHALLGGAIEMIRYRDPVDGGERYAVFTALDPGSDCRVVDYPDLRQATAGYEESVYANVDEELPYASCDMAQVRIERRSKPPSGLSAMTTASREWGPVETTVQDVTPAVWGGPVGQPPNDLALAALPDGRQLLVAADDTAARLWSLGDGRLVREFTGHRERVLSVALTVRSDGVVLLATGGQDRLARIWSARDSALLLELPDHAGPVNAVAWAGPPGAAPWLVTGGDDATVRVWEAETGRLAATLRVGTPSVDLIWSLATTVLADGHVCVVAGVDDADSSFVYVWDVTAGTTLHRFVVERDGFGMAVSVAVAALVDRSYRVAVAAGPVVRVWDGHTGQELRTFGLAQGTRADVALAVLPDLRVALAATGAHETVVWDVESSAVLTRIEHQKGGLAKAVDLVVGPDGGLLLATGRDGDTPARILRLDPRW